MNVLTAWSTPTMAQFAMIRAQHPLQALLAISRTAKLANVQLELMLTILASAFFRQSANALIKTAQLTM
jgi:hypothetical protein